MSDSVPDKIYIRWKMNMEYFYYDANKAKLSFKVPNPREAPRWKRRFFQTWFWKQQPTIYRVLRRQHNRPQFTVECAGSTTAHNLLWSARGAHRPTIYCGVHGQHNGPQFTMDCAGSTTAHNLLWTAQAAQFGPQFTMDCEGSTTDQNSDQRERFSSWIKSK